MKYSILLLLFISCTSFGQQIYVEAGKTASSFDFKNSQGTSLENLQATTQNYVEVGYKHQIFTEKLSISLGASYNSYGSIGSDTALNNFFEWDVDYLGIHLGIDYSLFTIEDLTFFIKATPSIEFIVQGSQTINNQVFNIVGVEEFDNTAVFLRGGAGIRYPISERSKVYVQYEGGKSLVLKNKNGSSQSQLTINTNMVGLGLLIDISVKEKIQEIKQVDPID